MGKQTTGDLLTLAIFEDSYEGTIRALRAGADPFLRIVVPNPHYPKKSLGAAAWHCAAACGATNAMRAMIEEGVDVERANRDVGWRALHYAALWSQLPAVRLLLASGAEATPLSGEGKTPLQYVKHNKRETREKIDELKAVLRAAAGGSK